MRRATYNGQSTAYTHPNPSLRLESTATDRACLKKAKVPAAHVVLAGVAVLWLIFGVLDSRAAAQERAGAQEANAGVVGELSGDWYLADRSGRIQRGQALPTGGKIVLASKGQNARGSYIKIYLLNGGLMSVDCDKLMSLCERPIPLPETIQSPPSLGDRFWALLKGLVSRSERLASTLSRGDELQDGIVKLVDGKVDLGSVFRKMKPGRYLLRFQSIAPSRATSEPAVAQLEFTWELGRSLPLYAPGLRPSLFQVDLLDASTEKPETLGIDAWVLLVKSADYEKCQKAFRDVQTLTGSWGDDSKAESARTFLRAYLEYLATQEAR